MKDNTIQSELQNALKNIHNASFDSNDLTQSNAVYTLIVTMKKKEKIF